MKIGVSGEFRNLGMSFGSTMRAPKPVICPFSSRIGIMMRLRKRSKVEPVAPALRIALALGQQARLKHLLLAVAPFA